MYTTHNEGKPVIAGRFIKTLKDKIYKTMTASHSKFYLLNKLVDEYNKIIIVLLANNILMVIEKIKFIHKAPKSKVGDSTKSTKSTKIFLAKVTLKIGQEKYLLLILC